MPAMTSEMGWVRRGVRSGSQYGANRFTHQSFGGCAKRVRLLREFGFFSCC